MYINHEVEDARYGVRLIRKFIAKIDTPEKVIERHEITSET